MYCILNCFVYDNGIRVIELPVFFFSLYKNGLGKKQKGLLRLDCCFMGEKKSSGVSDYFSSHFQKWHNRLEDYGNSCHKNWQLISCWQVPGLIWTVTIHRDTSSIHTPPSIPVIALLSYEGFFVFGCMQVIRADKGCLGWAHSKISSFTRNQTIKMTIDQVCIKNKPKKKNLYQDGPLNEDLLQLY